MKRTSFRVLSLVGVVAMMAICPVGTMAVTRYVWTNSPSPNPPYDDWTNAAHDIQSAVDAATNGDTVLVTNGVYATDGRAMSGIMTNRVAVDRPITLQSVNGPEFTFIVGNGPLGTGAVRCVYLTNGAALIGFTLTNGYTLAGVGIDREQRGAGVWAESTNAVVSNCVLVGNSASFGGGSRGGTLWNCVVARNTVVNWGGGAYEGTLYNSVLFRNQANFGGGMIWSVLNNCTVVGNTANYYGGGAYQGVIENSILYHNAANGDTNWYSGAITNTCTFPLPDGTGNITNEPQIASLDNPRLVSGGPCIDAGANRDWMAAATDLDGEPRTNAAVDMGADEYWAAGLTGALSAAIAPAYTEVAARVAVSLEALIEGRPQGYRWDFGDGLAATNLCRVAHDYAEAGTFPVTLTVSNLSGTAVATASVHVIAADCYVATNGNDAWPGTNWATAKATIQAAVDAAPVYGRVWVSNGVYNAGGKAGYPVGSPQTNRVAIYKPLTVQSVNGPDDTVIAGSGPLGDAAVRCVYLTNGATLNGFTLSNGYTRTTGNYREQSGGGVYSELRVPVVSNCVIVGCRANENGGGSMYGMLYQCTLRGNAAPYGGGATYGNLYNCTVAGNTARVYGGGVDSCTLYGGLLIGNVSSNRAGGASWADLYSCTVVGNSAVSQGGGVEECKSFNSIVYHNTAPSNENWMGGVFTNCCTTPAPTSGANNITAPPFVVCASNPRLLPESPCVNAGLVQSWMSTATDMDGEPRLNGIVDIGADECWAGALTGTLSAAIIPTSQQAVAWLPASLEARIEGKCVGYVWNFGDGSEATNLYEVEHTFTNTGVFGVTLTASNLTGMISATATVQVATRDYYVAPDGNDTWAGTNWATAKATIQAAIDAAPSHGCIWVTNGTYATGGRPHFPWGWPLTNRVALYKPVTVQSVNGPWNTVIVGAGPNGDDAVRCAYLTNGAALIGFMLTNGHTHTLDDPDTMQSGGGAWSEPTNGIAAAEATISNCVFVGNSANDSGGGAYRGALYNCLFQGNSADHGGGAYGCRLVNCTLTANGASSGGGVYGGTLENGLVYYNSGYSGANWLNAGASYSCTFPLPAGAGNFTNEPGIVSLSNPRLLATSPCREAGLDQSWMAGASDMDSEPRLNGVVDVGADEYWASGMTGSLSAAISVVATQLAVGSDFSLEALIQGRAQGYSWNFGDDETGADQFRITHAWTNTGTYAVTLTASNLSGSVTATVVVHVLVGDYYVATNGNDGSAGTNWATAKATIQAAVDAAPYAGGRIWVTNGIYDTGSVRSSWSATSNRVAITKLVTVRSINGPDYTAIAGGGVQDASSAVRCVYITNGAALIGFTLTNGHTAANDWGGGICCEDTNSAAPAYAVISNCVIIQNSSRWGGGVYGGQVYDCRLVGNSAECGGGAYGGELCDCDLIGNSAVAGGGAYESTLRRCTLVRNTVGGFGSGGGAVNAMLYDCVLTSNSAYDGGGADWSTLYDCDLLTNSAGSQAGGAFYSTLYNCRLIGNSATYYGGGTMESTLYDCWLVGNTAGTSAGAAFDGTLNNCTVVGNSAGWAGGAWECTVNNSLLYYNSGAGEENWTSGSTLTRTCTVPLPSGTGNFTNPPQIASVMNPRLMVGSPCVNAGSGSGYSATDIDGEPRTNGVVDVGADELWVNGLTGLLSAAISAGYTQAAAGFSIPFEALVEGRPVGYVWAWGDEQCSTNYCRTAHAYSSSGTYTVTLTATNLDGSAAASASVHIVGGDIFVAPDGDDLLDGTSWATAKATIQAGVDAAPLGGRVWVTNGTYNTAGRAGYPAGSALTNRVAIYKSVTVQSVNGPEVTFIMGSGPEGNGAVRCAYLTNGAVLAGFTLTNGHTRTSGDYDKERSGGIVWCEATNATAPEKAVISNCVLVGGSANYRGGGAYMGALYRCTVAANSAGNSGGGVCQSGGSDCVLMRNSAPNGGGAYLYPSTLVNCILSNNTATGSGGGLWLGKLYNCLLVGNQSGSSGGGAYGAWLYNCTVCSNSAGTVGGGVQEGSTEYSVENCIVYYNTASSNANWSGTASYGRLCTTPKPSGSGHVTNEPAFVNPAAGDYRLATNSPCRDAGVNRSWMSAVTDLEGKPRILNGTNDIGAYEFIPRGLDTDGDGMPDYWEWDYGHTMTNLPPNSDLDGDGFINLHEYLAGTNPTNAASFLGFDHIGRSETGTGVVVRWQSVDGKWYRLERGTNLADDPTFGTPVRTNILGVAPLNTETDTNAVGTGPWYYRIKLE